MPFDSHVSSMASTFEKLLKLRELARKSEHGSQGDFACCFANEAWEAGLLFVRPNDAIYELKEHGMDATALWDVIAYDFPGLSQHEVGMLFGGQEMRAKVENLDWLIVKYKSYVLEPA